MSKAWSRNPNFIFHKYYYKHSDTVPEYLNPTQMLVFNHIFMTTKRKFLFQVTFHCHFFLCLYEVHRQYWSIDCKSRSFLNGSAALLPQNTKVGYHVYLRKTQKKQVFVRKCHNLISNKTN